MPRPHLIALLLGLTLVGCDRPPATAYYTAATVGQGTPIGTNMTNEACTLVDLGGGRADIYCGAWQQPSARIRRGGPTGRDSLVALATTSAWRVELDSRFTCGEPNQQSAATVVLQCARRAGGWPQIGLATIAGGNAWLADGTPASYPAIQRAIALLSGGGAATTGVAPISADMARYLGSATYSADDILQYENLMQAGLRANLAGRPDDAEKSYRRALALEEKKQGKDSSAKAAPLMSIGLQLSDQGKFDDAKVFFDRAHDVLRNPDATRIDVNGPARLALYKGLDALNRGDPKTALRLLDQAEAGFQAQALDARDVPGATPARLPSSNGLAVGDQGRTPYATLSQKEALLGILEARRNYAIAERMAGDPAGAEASSRAVEVFAKANGLTSSLYTARMYRTAGISAEVADRRSEAVDQLAASVQAFQAAQPRTRPTAEAELTYAGVLAKTVGLPSALAQCRAAAARLRDTRDGVGFDRMAPCLDIYARQAAQPDADSQALFSEMFAAAQLTRGGITDQEIRLTAVRLAAGNGDPRISEAIRRQQDADRDLADLLRQRDMLGQGPDDPGTRAAVAAKDKDIAAARAKLADADSVVQAAAPNYQQLIQQPVRPDDVFAALRPHEAFVAITVAANGGWTFLLRDHRIAVARIDLNQAQLADLVRRMRAGIEPGDDNKVPEFNVDVARKLYDVTLGGVARAMDGVEALTVAPTGPLLSIPFEVLLTGPADPRNLTDAPFLLRKYVISHVPAAANFVRLRQTAPSRAANAWFGFGDFVPITKAQAQRTYPAPGCGSSANSLSGLPALAGTRTELRLASQVFAAPATAERIGAAFTAGAVETLDLKDYRIVHFAAHALLPSELACQDEPAIVTSAPRDAPDARGALLTSSDVEGLKLDADAVILSACNSGGGDGRGGESLAGLARAFFYAGARSLMITHWTVDDSAALLIVSKTLLTLHDDRAGGLAAAMRQAQLYYLGRSDIGAPLKHPYYWAPFAVVGADGGHAQTASIQAAPDRRAGL